MRFFTVFFGGIMVLLVVMVLWFMNRLHLHGN
jgi:hypothetical protein